MMSEALLRNHNPFAVAAGSARTVNRRYIADFVRKAARTKASAGELQQSLPAALGPLCLVGLATPVNACQ